VSLYHPPHVAAALVAVGNMARRDIPAALRQHRPRSSGYIPSEVIVRLLRRARVADDRWLEDILFTELSRRLQAWARHHYQGIRPEDRLDLAHELCLRIVDEIAKNSGIDFWEITFHRLISKAAADIYQARFVPMKFEDQLEGYTEVGDQGDSGAMAENLETKVLLSKQAQTVLTPKEFALFCRMYLTDLPIKADKASTDLVRETGIPEGTLREMKATILRKLTPSKERP